MVHFFHSFVSCYFVVIVTVMFYFSTKDRTNYVIKLSAHVFIFVSCAVLPAMKRGSRLCNIISVGAVAT